MVKLMSYDDEFERSFPALSREIRENRTKRLRISGNDTMFEEPDNPELNEPLDKTFIPSVIDYIRRCDTVSQALEIVDFMLRQGEISGSEARDLKRRLENEGLRSFGEKKESDYYLRHGIE
ncbi:MAG: DUF2095 family protein [Candidatus Thorarchaeota archaeon]